ncbi:MAG: cold shock domain-containing protein [Candidatus Doudnabacteria bacterium]|nr:cold shock domain-containing protein [Candidatus Doudnabacteria bacterium]
MRHKGTVKWFRPEKGYGFLVVSGIGDVFVHHSEINMPGYRSLIAGQKVTFLLINGPKGPYAEEVVLVPQRMYLVGSAS